MRFRGREIKSVQLNIFLIGFVTIISQIVVIREAMTFFPSAELSVGVTLGCWLLFSAVGSFLAGYSRKEHSGHLFVFLQILLVLALVVEFYMLRNARSLLSLPAGEILPVFDILKYSPILMFPLPVVTGALFPVSVNWINSLKPSDISNPAGQVYYLEILGNMAGGLICTILFIYGFSTFFMGALIISTLVTWLIVVLIPGRPSDKYPLISGILVIILGVSIVQATSSVLQKADFYLRAKSVPELNVVLTMDSKHGNLIVGESNGLYAFYLNGSLSFHAPDPFYAEELVNLAALQKPGIKSVLMIGGGLNGSIEQILNYDIKNLDYLEFDQAVLAAASNLDPFSRFFETLEKSKDIVSVYYGDPWKFVNSAESNSYDLVITQLPGPSDALTARYYSREFFHQVKRILRSGGVFSFGLVSEANYMSDELLAVNGTVYHTLDSVFDKILVTAEDFNYFVATDTDGSLTFDASELAGRIRSLNLDLRYLDYYYLVDRLDPDRILQLIDRFESMEMPEINTLMSPRIYFRNLMFTSTRDYIGSDYRFSILPGIFVVAAVIGLVIMLINVFTRKNQKNSNVLSVFLFVTATGFAAMGLEIILIYLYQSYSGYLYEMIGIIVAIFMLGMGTGGYLAKRLKPGQEIKSIKFSLLQMGILFILILLLTSMVTVMEIWMIGAVIMLLIFIPGYCAGLIYPSSVIYLERMKYSRTAAGKLYAADLIGASFGAILVSVIFIPLSNILVSIFLVMMVFMMPAILFLIRSSSQKKETG